MSGALDDACQALLDTEKEISQIEESLKDANARRHNLRSDIIPTLMTELGFTEVVKGKKKIKLTEWVSGNLPKDDLVARKKAIKWLEEHDGDHLLKSQVSIDFPKSQREDAKQVFDNLEKDGHPVTLSETAHPSSLHAYIRQRMRDGESVDADTLGLDVGIIAKVSTK